jgi:hypothetical protein
MKQTAVEWLQDTWLNYPDLCTYEKIQEWFDQAKAMEKEQIKNAIICNQNGLLRRKTVLEAEQYYNETYKK